MIDDRQIDELIQRSEVMEQDVARETRCLDAMGQLVKYKIKQAYKAVNKRVHKARPNIRFYPLNKRRRKLKRMKWWYQFHPVSVLFQVWNGGLLALGWIILGLWATLALSLLYGFLKFIQLFVASGPGVGP